MHLRDQWSRTHLFNGKANLPFSFIYDGQAAGPILATWPEKHESKQIDGARTQHITLWTDAKTGLEVRCVAVDYADFPVIEWTVYIRNTGKAPTLVLEGIQGLDVVLDGQGDVVLRHNQGDTCAPNAYEPFCDILGAGKELRFAPVGGRPTSMAFPYFNLQHGVGGTIIALGWPGQWAASFARDAQGTLRVQGGQELTRLRLLPGEEIRTPLVALMFWDGTHRQSQNLWRRWMLKYGSPQQEGRPPQPISAAWGGTLLPKEADQKEYIDLLVSHDAAPRYWWIDAGWYIGAPGVRGEHNRVGTWRPDPVRFPGGIKSVSDFAHARGMKLVVWFEIERVGPGAEWRKHSDWLLAIKPESRIYRMRPDIGSQGFTTEEAECNQIREDDRILNLGNADARRFVTDYISACIEQWGIDLFRLDHNISPLLFWREADAALSPVEHDRQGITENHYVTGLLAFLDELRSRHPQLLIDGCAAGGRRIDLETMRRTVVFTRSDYWKQSTAADQCQTAGLAAWVPYYLGAGPYDDTYRFRSNLAPSMEVYFDMEKRDQVDWTLFRQRLKEWREFSTYFYGDYHPLTVWSSNEDAPMAWQFNRPEHGDGIVQAFRRTECAETTQILRLSGLDPAAQYELRNMDIASNSRVPGKDLMEKGLTVEINNKPGAALVTYRRIA